MTEEDTELDPSHLMEDYINVNHLVFADQRFKQKLNEGTPAFVEKMLLISPPLILTVDRSCQTSLQQNSASDFLCPQCHPTNLENTKLKTQIDEISIHIL